MMRDREKINKYLSLVGGSGGRGRGNSGG